MSRTLISIVVPVYNEEEVLLEFHRRLLAVRRALDVRTEVIYVNDGSRDATPILLARIREEDPSSAVIDLSRNFGKEIALSAGIDHAGGDAVIVIDADLQDPPELIPELIAAWRDEGCDVVYAQRIQRDGETLLKRATAHLFYRIMRHAGRVKIPLDTGDFRLMSRRAVDALVQYRENHRFMKGLFALIGFEQRAVPYRRDPRFAGATKWNYWRLLNLAIEGITSFTVAPLKFATLMGFAVAAASFVYAAAVIYKTLVYGADVAGYPSLMVVILFLGGVQLLSIGILGEYLGRIFNETKGRPLYHVKSYVRASSAQSGAEADRDVPQAV